jgi:hypothetical protein
MLLVAALLLVSYLEVCRSFLMFLSLLVDNGVPQTTSVASLLLSAALPLLAMVCSNSTLTAAHPHPCTLKHPCTTPLHRPDSHTSAQVLMLQLLTLRPTLLNPLRLQHLPLTQAPLSSPCKAWCPASL